nr:monodehydroascorbate reductase [Tanacetum cinerariifolium]
MRNQDSATWDRKHSTWDGREELFGTALVVWGCTRRYGEGDEGIVRLGGKKRCDTMADVNVNAPIMAPPTMAPPTRTDDQILHYIRWVPIGKRNCYLDVEKSQSNPIYKIAVDILKHTNFFRAFTASSTIPSIYIQQFWDIVRYDKTAGCYKCQLDEQWFDLTKDTLKDSLQITPVNNNQAFTSPLSSDVLINFVNELGYPKLVRNLSNVVTNNMFKPLRALTTIINLCLTGKTSGFERPMDLVLQILWGRKHKFHPRPDSPLHLPNEEPVLGYLKFSAKGTKREFVGMPIPGNLITADIQGESYYQEYLVKVAKHQIYLAGEIRSDPDCPALKPTKTAKKSKPTAPKADPRPPVSKPASSQQPEPNPHQPSLRERSARCSPRSVDESVAEDVPEKEPRVDNEEADVQRELEERSKSIYDVPWGSLPPMVIREPESEKYQPLPEVPGKGKEKVTEEQIARDLLTLQTPKKKSHANRYIFQRRTSIPTRSSGHDESSSLYAELGLTDSEEESNKDVPWTDAGVQGEGQAGPNPDAKDEDLEHMDLDVADVSIQPHPEKIDEGFTATAYPKVQENLKLTVEEHVILEEPASSSGTLSYLQHLTKDLSFGDLFFNDKPLKADNDKTTAKTKAKSIVSVMIQQDTSSIPPMTTLIIDLTLRPESPKVHHLLKATAIETTTTTTIHPPPSQPQQSTTDSMLMKHIDELKHIMANLIQDNKQLEQRLDSHGARLYTLEQLDIPHQVSKDVDEVVADAVDWAIQAPLRNRFRDLPEADMKEILHQRMWETNSYKTYEDQMQLYEALEKSTNRGHSEELLKDLAEARKKKKKRLPPSPPPPPSTNQEDLQIDDDMAPDAQAQSSDDEDIGNAHIPKASALVSTYSPPPEDSLLAQTGDIALFMDWFLSNGKCHKLLTDSVDDSILRHNVSKPLPLGGPPSQIDEALDYKVKEFKVNMINPGLNIRFWTRKDMDRSKEFMFAIQKRLKTRRIFHNLERFVGGRVRD